jgi:hypothetical protein
LRSVSWRFSSELNQSDGDVNGDFTSGCVGCHGRAEDGPGQIGDGLRAHHAQAGIGVCAGCHPSDTTPVSEDTPPENYFTPDGSHAGKPSDPCNTNGTESRFGLTGLDNDGDGLYDENDPDCVAGPVCGDGVCEGDEDDSNCIEDCDTCGNGICGPDETQANCSADCSTPVGPVLEIPFEEPALGGGTVEMPVMFTQTTAGDINSIVFSVDYDETNLTIDPTNNMGLPWPDAISIHPDIFNNSFFWTIEVSLNADDTEGELDVAFSSSSRLVPEGDLVTMIFDVGNPLVSTH